MVTFGGLESSTFLIWKEFIFMSKNFLWIVGLVIGVGVFISLSCSNDVFEVSNQYDMNTNVVEGSEETNDIVNNDALLTSASNLVDKYSDIQVLEGIDISVSTNTETSSTSTD